tara:strand:+ start:1102 stop:1962 length:861 start_codon:yes stop_codon:yes gene_type:complete
MRRKFFNAKSIIYIILIAIFTLTSYISDQGVIRQEDNLRKSDIKIDNLTTQIYDVNAMSNQFLSLQMFFSESLVEFHRNQLIWIKSLILLERNSKNIDKNMSNNLIDYNYTIESVKSRFNNHYYQIFVKSLEIVDKFEDIHTWNQSYFIDYFDKEDFYIEEKLKFDFRDIFENNLDSFNIKDVNIYYPPPTTKAFNEFTIINYLDIYTFSHFLLRNMEDYSDIIIEESNKIKKLGTDYSQLLYDELSVNKSISSLKNYLVLVSIISQILSLFFLLLFFRNLLINKI